MRLGFAKILFLKMYKYASIIEWQPTQSDHAYIELVLAVDICFLPNKVFHNIVMTT